jgi:ribose 5-phosphate isomerase B
MIEKIYFATDHAGLELKDKLVPFVRDVLGYDVVDCGAFTADFEDDYTDFIPKAAREVSLHPTNTRAIILGGSGQGEAILANRFAGIRAVVYYGGNEEIIKLSRVHNDANVLSLGARFISYEEAKSAVMLWLHTTHEPVSKYDRRIAKMEKQTNGGGVSSEHALATPIHTTTYSIAPSLPASSFAELYSLSQILSGEVSELQVDIVDGVFAPAISWPFTEKNPKAEFLKVRQLSKNVSIEVDCMCLRPESYLDVFVEAGVSRVIIHAGSTTEYEKCIAHARAYGYKIGLAVLNTSDPKLFDTYATYFDFVQVMGIAAVGAQGQPFDTVTLKTVFTLRTKYPRLEIAVDGSVNEQTIVKLKEAGANRFAPGSAIAKATDPAASYKALCSLIGL